MSHASPKLRSSAPTRLCYLLATTFAVVTLLAVSKVDWVAAAALFRATPSVVPECQGVHAHTNLSTWPRSRPAIVAMIKCVRALSVH